VLIALASGCAAGNVDVGKAYDPPENYPRALEQVTLASNLVAAILVAYEADRGRFEEHQQIDLTPQEFTKRHEHVFITRLDDGAFDVHMGPEVREQRPGIPIPRLEPGRRYIIDAKSLRVVDAFFDR
jgi:hypothetical protein